MARIEASKRVKSGKSIKVEIEMENERIKDFIISGDFFAYPLEQFEELQREVLENGTAENITSIINEYKKKIEFTGINIQDIEDLILECLTKHHSI
ncbi:MAG: lipoate protein ligase C-terminal domain-containing protein [Nitrososphaeria archaeon]